MTAWQAFALGCIVTIVIEAMIRVALWLTRSRPLADAMEGEHGDWPHMGR